MDGLNVIRTRFHDLSIIAVERGSSKLQTALVFASQRSRIAFTRQRTHIFSFETLIAEVGWSDKDSGIDGTPNGKSSAEMGDCIVAQGDGQLFTNGANVTDNEQPRRRFQVCCGTDYKQSTFRREPKRIERRSCVCNGCKSCLRAEH